MGKKEQKKTPDFYVYTKVPDGKDGFKIGVRLGVGFKHNNDTGLNILLDAQPIPVNGRIELVAFTPQKNDE